MNAESYYIGLDVSTQGAKLLVLDYEQRSVIFSKSLNYDKDLPQYQTLDGHRQNAGPGVSESDPRMWLEAVDRLFLALQNAGVNTQAVRAIAVAGQQHGLVCLDRHGALTRNFAKLWNDTSTEQECEELTAAIGGPEAMIAAVGHVQKPGFTASKILHFKKEDPAAFARTSTFLLVHNYINYYLSGGVKAMEPGDASGTALMQPDDHTWCRRLTDFIDPQLIDKLPPITPSSKFIGSISPRLASKYGLREDCLIDAGSGDNMFGAIGSGNIQEGVVTVSLGTSGTAYALSENPCRSADGELASFCDATGRYLPLVCVANLANGYNQFLEQQQLSHEDFEELIKHSPAGNQGRVLIPWFAGERTPNIPHASPVFFGFGLADFTQAFLARALLEGHVLNLYEASLSLPIKPNVIHLTGGLARSGAFRQAIADIFDVKVRTVQGEGAALGAALHAAWLDQDSSLPELCQELVVFDEAAETQASPMHQLSYQNLKKLYHGLSSGLRGEKSPDDLFALRRSLLANSSNISKYLL